MQTQHDLYFTPSPSPFDTVQTTTVVGIPFQPSSFSNNPSPVREFIGSGFNPPSSSGKIVIDEGFLRTLTAANGSLPASAINPGTVRPYIGPEEITRSRFRQQDEWLAEQKRDADRRKHGGQPDGSERGKQFVKMELLNE